MTFSRLGLIGDVHAEAGRLEAALRFLRRAEVDQILCVGDVVDGHGNAERCCELLEQEGVLTVRGNHDRRFLASQMRDLPNATPWDALSDKSREFLHSLPATRSIETVAGPLLLCHGLGDNDMQRLKPDDYGYALEVKEELHALIREGRYRFMVGGHTHYRMVRHFGPLSVINVGTLFSTHEPCIAIADFRSGTVSFYEFSEDIVTSEGPPISLTANR